MTNIRAVSKTAGVSIATVSRTLSSPEKVSEKTAKKVFDAIEKVGYKPNMMARNFRAARTFSFIVLVPDIANAFFAKAISAIEEAAHQRGYSVLLGVTNDLAEREQKYIQLVETRQADGIIQLRPHAKADTTPPDISIVNACGCEDTPYTCVRIDNVSAAQEAITHFIMRGHKRIGLVTGKAENPHSIDRLKGCQLAVNNHKLSIKSSHIYEGDFGLESGRRAAKFFGNQEPAQRPSAVFCFNDEMAIGMLRGLCELGIKVPNDISIIGFDDIANAAFTTPSLTTVSQPADTLGSIATHTLIDMIEGTSPSSHNQIVEHQLIIRESS